MACVARNHNADGIILQITAYVHFLKQRSDYFLMSRLPKLSVCNLVCCTVTLKRLVPKKLTIGHESNLDAF